jgi:hypothetical protein
MIIPVPFSPFEQEQIVELYAKGNSISEIAFAFDTVETAIRIILKRKLRFYGRRPK